MSDRIFVATRKGLFTVDRKGDGPDGWSVTRTTFLGDPVSIVFPDPRDGYVYAALHHGHFGIKLQRSPDGGTTWQQCAAPTFPKPPEDAEEIRCPNRGIVIPWNTELIWSLVGCGADQPGSLWCGTVPGGLFRSDDRGDSWRLIRSLWDEPKRKEWFGGGMDYPGIHSVCVDPRNSKRVTVGISCGGVWVTEDAGDSWTCRAEGMWAAYMPPDRKNDPNIQDPHCLAMCPADPDVVWCQHHNGVFRTTDGAVSWHDIPGALPSTFGFVVVAHPRDPQTAWFVPAIEDEKRIPVDGRFVVSRTSDGGKSFEVLRSGLPQAHAYDLVFRHAADVDATGARLAVGSTTGSLWVSESGGDGWCPISSNLPPVYCIRFAES